MRPFCVISGLGLASAIIWDGPKPTNPASLVTASVSPKPTEVAELVKRDAWPASFCGFVGGISSLGATCSPHSSCVWNTDYFVVGCCATESKACLFFTSCIDENSPATAADDSLVFTCRGTKTCFQNNYPSNYRQWGCGYNATFIALTYQNMSADAATIQQAYIGTAELLAMTTVTATANYTVTAVPDSSSGTPSTGTIIGAAIGGAAILVVGAAIIAALLLRRRKSNQPAISGPISPMSSPGMTAHGSAQMVGFHHQTGSYFNKDQFQPVVPGTGHSPGHSTSTHSYPQVYQGYQPPPQPSPNHVDAIYHAYRPPQSPGPMPMSPTPREMDARSTRSFGGISRKPVAGHDEPTPPLPFASSMH
ncbi:hypothetical protein BKA61DRAFT_623722 [Leptodontidium sp. MPI-SDFR-AT-0119]|nr:hypothetical protein BKA61DRAFT_623722 [Leptodontidium sp. MPI-SDFR-AT-0119]